MGPGMSTGGLPMSKIKFNEYVEGGYWIHRYKGYRAIIKVAADGWYGGACTEAERTVPLHGPFRFKFTAKRIAMEKLGKIYDEENPETWYPPFGERLT